MNFTYTETQDMIRDTLARFLGDTYDFETRQKFINSDSGRDPAIWTALAQELGMLGAPFAEEHGGLGGGALENAIVMEELGKVIGIEPYLPTVVIAGGDEGSAAAPRAASHAASDPIDSGSGTPSSHAPSASTTASVAWPPSSPTHTRRDASSPAGVTTHPDSTIAATTAVACGSAPGNSSTTTA